jgi:hypothetical protein
MHFGRLQACEFFQVAREIARLRENAGRVIDDQATGLAGFECPRRRVDEARAEACRVECQQAPGERFGVQSQCFRGAGNVRGRNERQEVQQARCLCHGAKLAEAGRAAQTGLLQDADGGGRRCAAVAYHATSYGKTESW